MKQTYLSLYETFLKNKEGAYFEEWLTSQNEGYRVWVVPVKVVEKTTGWLGQPAPDHEYTFLLTLFLGKKGAVYAIRSGLLPDLSVRAKMPHYAKETVREMTRFAQNYFINQNKDK